MKNILIAFAVFLSLCFIVPVSAKATTFDIVVPLDVVVPIRGAQCALTFNPAVCQCLGIAEGNFLNDWAVANHDVTIE